MEAAPDGRGVDDSRYEAIGGRYGGAGWWIDERLRPDETSPGSATVRPMLVQTGGVAAHWHAQQRQ